MQLMWNIAGIDGEGGRGQWLREAPSLSPCLPCPLLPIPCLPYVAVHNLRAGESCLQAMGGDSGIQPDLRLLFPASVVMRALPPGAGRGGGGGKRKTPFATTALAREFCLLSLALSQSPPLL